MGIRLEVTTHPQFTVEELAFQLAEAMQGAIVCQRDAEAFGNQMQIENRKIAELEFVIRQVEAFHKNPPSEVSRMEPLMSYDIEKLREEIQEAKVLRTKWAEERDSALQKVARHKAEQGRLQGEINSRNKSKK